MGNGKKKKGAGPLMDTGIAGDLVTTGTGYGAMLDVSKTGSLGQAGSGGVSTAMSVASGANTYLTHDAAQEEGAAAHGERAAVGAMDALWGIKGGPVAVLDSLTGGHIGGVLKAGASGIVEGADLLGQLAAGAVEGDLSALDTESLSQYAEGMQSGQYGGIVEWLTTVGENAGEDPRAQLMAEMTEGEVSPFMMNPYEY